MSEKITEYKCPACTGPLTYTAGAEALQCAYCGQTYTPAEVEALFQAKNEEAEAAFAEAQTETPWDYSALKEEWDAEADTMRVLGCTSCGAELLCEATTAADACPYCGNSVLVPGQLAGDLKPDVILPFKLSKAQAVAALKKHYSKKWLLPSTFSAAEHIEKIQGVYVPFWLYDAQVAADCRFDGRKVRVYRRGNYEITETKHFNVRRGGTVEFVRVPVDGSRKMDDKYMDSLEPFDYAQLEPFSTAFLPGYLADRYDEGASDCAERANRRCVTSAIAEMRGDVHGYSSVSQQICRTQVHRGQVHYALLPVWVLHTKWNKKDFLFMMNGQTGKMIGDLPVDKRKFWTAVGGGTALFAVLLYVLRIAPFIGGMLARWVLGIG